MRSSSIAYPSERYPFFRSNGKTGEPALKNTIPCRNFEQFPESGDPVGLDERPDSGGIPSDNRAFSSLAAVRLADTPTLCICFPW
jgi:hypothetical protein